jgi:hypothetical protein
MSVAAVVRDNNISLGVAIHKPFKMAAALSSQPQGERVAGGPTSEAGEHEESPTCDVGNSATVLLAHDTFD